MKVALGRHHEERGDRRQRGTDSYAREQQRRRAGVPSDGGHSVDEKGGEHRSHEGQQGQGVDAERGQGFPDDGDSGAQGGAGRHTEQVRLGQGVAEDPLERGTRGGERGADHKGEHDAGQTQIEEQSGRPLGEVARGVRTVADQGRESAEGLAD